MKKYLFLLFSLFFITACSSKTTQNIDTIIEEDKNILIGINYPITGIKKLDSIIKEDVEIKYNIFKEKYETFSNLKEQSELNIDYTYEITNDRYINITLHSFINSSTIANPDNNLKSYVFDKQQNKLLTIHDIIDDNNFSNFVGYVQMELIKKYKDCILWDKLKSTITEQYDFSLFTLDSEMLTVYFNPTDITASYCDIVSIEIPLNQLQLKIKITPDVQVYTTTTFTNTPKVIDENQKVVAITFDDGPSKYTKEILEILKQNEACATFFVIGNKVEIYQETMRKMVAYGNEIGNHSYNHKWLTKLTLEDLQEQIMKTQNIITSVTGYTPTIMRPTYGSINNELRKNLNLDIIMWTVDTSDWKYKSVDRIVKNAIINTKDLDIILMHDTHRRTIDALEKIIPKLKKQGFEFVTISELNEIKKLRKQHSIQN